MNHDPESLGVALNADVELPSETTPTYDCVIYRFEDSRLQYEMHVHPATGATILSMDPTEPMQACPMLEFSFRFTEILIGKSAYDVDGHEIAVRFYEGENSPDGHRLTMTWIPEGYWYIWANANTNPHPKNGG